MLDDLSWALYKSNILGVAIQSTLRSRLETEVKKLLTELYTEQTSLSDYQQAWLLRGDNPEMYSSPKKVTDCYKDSSPTGHSMDYSEQYLTLPKYAKGQCGDDVRGNKTYREIYHRYHFDGAVKKRGETKYTHKIEDDEILWITNLQKAMQKEIMERGIAVEMNPSSNYLIGTFKRYEAHPIFQFNSLELEECDFPLLVSINTDDQGVFDTSLENQYALLAIALEKAKNEQGERKYTPEAIYNWLDYVRKMGLQQSFL